MTSLVSVATLILVTVNQLLTACNCAQRVEKCDDRVWDINLSYTSEEGEADLVISASFGDKGPFARSILACQGLAVNGTGKEIIDTHKVGRPVVAYHISIPEAQDLDEFVSQDGWQNYSCILQLSPAPGEGEGLECEIRLRTVMGRMLPKCSLQRGQSLLQAVEVKQELAQVHLYFENSANDVFTQDSTCDTGNLLGHDHSQALEENMLPLAPPGVDSPVVDIDFFPDCDNDTIRALYTDKRMSDCHMELYLVCQEGLQLVRRMDLDFDDAAMTCDPPKPAYDRLLEHFQLTFYIESRPVVALLLLLMANLVPYFLLVPAVFIKVATGRGCDRLCFSPRRHQDGSASEKAPLLLSYNRTLPQSPPHVPQSPPHNPTLPQPPSHAEDTVFFPPIINSAMASTSQTSPITQQPTHSLKSPPPSSSYIPPPPPLPPIHTVTITHSPPPSTSHIPPPPPPPPIHTDISCSPTPSTSHIPTPPLPPPIHTDTTYSTSHIPPPPPPPPIHTVTFTHSPPPSTSHIPPPPPPPPPPIH